MRCLAWVAARAGLARGDELLVDTDGRPPRRPPRTRQRCGRRRVRRDGAGNVRARTHSGRRRLAVRSRCGRRRSGVSGRRSRDGKSPLRRVRRRPGNCARHDARAETGARPALSRAARTSSSWPRPGPIAWRCGCGSEAWGRRCRAAPAHAQPRPWPTAAASWGSTCKSTWPEEDCSSCSATRWCSVGPSCTSSTSTCPANNSDRHWPVSNPRAGGRQRRRLTATEVDLERPRQRARSSSAPATGRRRSRRPRRASTNSRNSLTPRGPTRSTASSNGAPHPTRRPTSARARPRNCAGSAKRSTSTS